jgi:hypothetical protein
MKKSGILEQAEVRLLKAKEMLKEIQEQQTLEKGLLPQPAPVSKKNPEKIMQQKRVKKNAVMGYGSAPVATPAPVPPPTTPLAMSEEKELIKFHPNGQWELKKVKKQNPDKEADAELGEQVEHLVEDHMIENADAEREEGHKIMFKEEESNSEMAHATASSIENKSKHLKALVGKAKDSPPWVVSKLAEAKNDVQDVMDYTSTDGMKKEEKGQPKVAKVMKEFKEGTLHSGPGGKHKVKSKDQAVAIALSQAGLSNKKS